MNRHGSSFPQRLADSVFLDNTLLLYDPRPTVQFDLFPTEKERYAVRLLETDRFARQRQEAIRKSTQLSAADYNTIINC